MSANAYRIEPDLNDSSFARERDRQDSQVHLKAPCPPPEMGDSDEPAPLDFVAFLGEQRGIDQEDAFDLLCRLLSEYRTPVRREIDVLKRSA